MRYNDLIVLLREIRDILIEINKKLNNLQSTFKISVDDINSVDPLILLELPDNLRTSYTVLLKLKKATAKDVANVTKRGRAIESHYLNTLVKMGYLRKERVGRKVYFYIR